MISILISLLIVCILASLAWYVITLLPQPLQRIAQIILVVLIGVFLVYLLLPYAAHVPSPVLRR